jgi:hypothetical protein
VGRGGTIVDEGRCTNTRRACIGAICQVTSVTLIIIIVVLLLVFGGGGGYYAHRSYGVPGLGGVLGLIVVVLVLLWLFGGLHLR